MMKRGDGEKLGEYSDRKGGKREAA